MSNEAIKEYCQAIKSRTLLGDYMNGLAIADRLVYSFPNSDKGYYYRAICYFGLNRLKEAAENYETAIRMNPTNAKAYFNLGTCYQKVQQYDLALINIGKALILFTKQNKQDAKLKCIDAINFIEDERKNSL